MITTGRLFSAKALYIPCSPYKLRPLVNVIRGKSLLYALGFLKTYKGRRVSPIKKAVDSAVANAKSIQGVMPTELFVKEISVEQGPIHNYFKPGAMGRAMPQRRRLSHIYVSLEARAEKSVVKKTEASKTTKIK